jgi:ADP-L-glycero-D-manno-heptose 6-epimerase
MSDKIIILTGGAGFIGSNFLQYLNHSGITNVLIVDNLGKTDKWRNLVGKRYLGYIHKDKFRFEYDFTSDSVEAIFHFGACSATTEKDVDYLYDNNNLFSQELCQFAVSANIPFHYASSAATYGVGEQGYSDENFDNLRPLNGYGWSKHEFDLWVRKMGFENKVCGYKFFNVFGPNEYHKKSMTSMVFKAFHQINETGKVKLFKSNDPEFSDGGQMRDFIYVKDVCDVMWKNYQTKQTGIFNLGTGKARTWNDLVNSVFTALNIESNIEYIEMPEGLQKQYQNYTQADMSKLKQTKFTSLEESVSDYVKNYLENDRQYL